MQEIAQDYYEYWFDKGKSFLDCKNSLEKGYLNNCAFELHQSY